MTGMQVVNVELGDDSVTNILSDSGMPVRKRIRLIAADDPEPSFENQSVKQILFNINKAICLRLDAMEEKIESQGLRLKHIEDKVDQLLRSGPVTNGAGQHNVVLSTPIKGQKSTVLVGLPQGQGNVKGPTSPLSSDDNSNVGRSMTPFGSNVTLITLNSEEDYPLGSWLGDESNPEIRVRAPVTPSDLLHIHSNCRTPEKMALTLLDYLFDRETQACSNLSGSSKYGKKQLDPLMIYGIRCHLIHRFGIGDLDWHRIKQNIDSKCRTAFRRKLRGQQLNVKAFRGKAPSMTNHLQIQAVENQNHILQQSGLDMGSQSDDSLQDEALQIHEEVDGQQFIPSSEIITAMDGPIQVIHATPEQVAQLQGAHNIQILHGDPSQLMLQDGIQIVNTGEDPPEGIHITGLDDVTGDVTGDDDVKI